MILDKIVADSRLELEHRKRTMPLEKLQELSLAQSAPVDLGAALRGDRIRLIAEIKRASPSKGVIRSEFNPVDIAEVYAANGASAISVLTEANYFQGSLDYLEDIGKALGDRRPPLLRKDFIYDSYQIYESRACGADCLLLIVAILAPEQLRELLELSHTLSMKCLVEVHNEAKLQVALRSGAMIIGINNRDLKTFTVDLATTERLRPLIPQDRIVVSESGIKNRSDIENLGHIGVDAVLVGELLMSAPDITSKMKELL